jgi:hypothetical protein
MPGISVSPDLRVVRSAKKFDPEINQLTLVGEHSIPVGNNVKKKYDGR